MKSFTLSTLLTGSLFACGDKETETAELEVDTDTDTDTDSDADSSVENLDLWDPETRACCDETVGICNAYTGSGWQTFSDVEILDTYCFYTNEQMVNPVPEEGAIGCAFACDWQGDYEIVTVYYEASYTDCDTVAEGQCAGFHYLEF